MLYKFLSFHYIIGTHWTTIFVPEIPWHNTIKSQRITILCRKTTPSGRWPGWRATRTAQLYRPQALAISSIFSARQDSVDFIRISYGFHEKNMVEVIDMCAQITCDWYGISMDFPPGTMVNGCWWAPVVPLKFLFKYFRGTKSHDSWAHKTAQTWLTGGAIMGFNQQWWALAKVAIKNPRKFHPTISPLPSNDRAT